MAVPTIYRSSDASAPILTGTAGDLVNLLDKILVNGYGAKAAAGWVRKTAFAGNSTQRAVFQQGAGAALFLDVDDRGATSVLTGASGKEAAVRGYEAMTNVSTGTNPFPTVAQQAAATANARKSATADATARPWICFADDRTFYLWVMTGDNNPAYMALAFGDFYSYKSADAYRTFCIVRDVVNATNFKNRFTASFTDHDSGNSNGWYAARRSDQSGTSENIGLITLGTAPRNNVTPFPASPDGNVHMARYLLGDSLGMRGYLRGIYQLVHAPASFNDGDTFSVTSGDFSGRNFQVVKFPDDTNNSIIAVETTAWDTSS